MLNKYINKVVPFVVVSLLLSSCSMFQSQKMIDNIIPDYSIRMYTVADLIPYSFTEIRNARALYGRELSKYFATNTSTAAEVSRTTDTQKNEFLKELLYRDHNYKIMKKRFAMYVDDAEKPALTKEEARKKEYDEYYKLQNAKGIQTIRKYNNGKVEGMPIFSLKACMQEATDSDCDLYTIVPCEIYEPVIIDNNRYKNLKIGDEISLNVPTTPSTVGMTKKKKVDLIYIATNSLMVKDSPENISNDKKYYFIADVDGTTGVRRVLTYSGKTLETYVEKKDLQFMKWCRVCEANEPIRLMINVANDKLEEYAMNELVERALCGGYLIYRYKDYVYANSVTVNKKGYITAMTEYTNQSIDNKFYNELNK